MLPEVGSSRTVSRLIFPSFSAASIIETPIRSFTLPAGFRISSLAATVAFAPSMMRLSRTSGVLPMVLVMSSAIRMVSLEDRKATKTRPNRSMFERLS